MAPPPLTNHTLPAQPPAGVLMHDGMAPAVTSASIYGRPGLGVPVLPPIGASRPLSPYGSSPVMVAPLPSVQPPPPPSFRLVDPRANLSPEQRVELDSLVAMGFQAPRVARALLKSGDKSKASVREGGEREEREGREMGKTQWIMVINNCAAQWWEVINMKC